MSSNWSTLFRSGWLTILSEFGDKTFFIAGILAIKYSKSSVLLGAMGAMVIMTCLSTLLGYFAQRYLISNVIDILSSVLLAIFGLKMLKEAYHMDPDEAREEYEEANEEIHKKLVKTKNAIFHFAFEGFNLAFVLTFANEWGDRSQLTNMALAAKDDPLAVSIGSFIGNGLCTGVAVLAGELLADRLSLKFITTLGGLSFLVLSVWSLIW